ncbi:ABC transporter permease [Rhodococcus sp. HNM0569]|uniref:ABC transporter permease n=1 Tax=Rhodococcus sp. HNM0569 TaxID=2716340 RepID=UPI00146A6EFF|nr:ABC transporter permease [Rhodococcus sp. HNM0569]NLU84998.1 ABC transporter permease [Rhodococcus sp. HNM0569]
MSESAPTQPSVSTHAPGDGAPGRGPLAAWRRFYSTLPPAVQLIGLQLWLPVFFIILFCLCYIAAFHAPKVHDAPVALAAPAVEQAQQVEQQLSSATRDAIAYRVVDGPDAAQDAVRSGEVVGALVFGDDPSAPPTLYTAGAHQFQAQQIVSAVFTPVFAAQGIALHQVDLAPLPANDSYGMTAMYLMLSWCIGGYMVAMFIGMMGAPLLHRTRVAIIVGGAAVLSLLANFLAGPVLGAIDGHFWQLVGIAFVWIIAIGLVVNGLSYFFGRFITVPALVIFVFLSIPASGAAYPTWMMPAVFDHLRPLVVGHGITEMIKHTVYGVGESFGIGFRQLVCYAVIGIVLSAVGKPWRQRREVARILAGKTTMMMDAQNAMREHGIEVRAEVLAKAGVPDAESEARTLEDEDERVGDAFTNYGHPMTGYDDEVTDSADARGPRQGQ